MPYENQKDDSMKSKLILLSSIICCACNNTQNSIDLSGEWQVTTDSTNWAGKTLILPGSLTSNGIGDEISLSTPWTGTIVDSSYFKTDEYAAYRQNGNIKVPFWLQPTHYYKGAAWYRKEVNIPSDWKGKAIELFLERCHWESQVWIDGEKIGMNNSLGTPHCYDLTQVLTPGTHTLEIRIDNRIKDIDPGRDSHSITDHTQGNWNGIIGDICLNVRPLVHVENTAIYTDIAKKSIRVNVSVLNKTEKTTQAILKLSANNKEISKNVSLKQGSNNVEATLELGEDAQLWDEFNPYLHTLQVSIEDTDNKTTDTTTEKFGLREVRSRNGILEINGRQLFLRGMLDCAAYPKTGFPPTDEESWRKLFNNCKKHGLNHVRFHSWCPPEAAFNVADEMGFYLQVECSSWANMSTTIGDGKGIDQYILDESERMVRAYGNHPSFCAMLYGNEPAGAGSNAYLEKFVSTWKAKDNRRLYSTAAGWPMLPVNDYQNDPTPRIQGWGMELKSIINGEAPRTNYDWYDYTSKYDQPFVSHEIGQWCVYPNFKEISKYDGVMRAHNFEIFQASLKAHGMEHLADSFLLASGKLQTLCYKADIEAALRTKNFGGFQLLGLYDFPGQGTALVGVLDAFGDEKGYVTPEEYSRFCNHTVPLARLPKLIYTNNETLKASVEIAHFGKAPIHQCQAGWKLTSGTQTLAESKWAPLDIAIGNNIPIGEIETSLANIKNPVQATLEVYVNEYKNSWNIWVYPKEMSAAALQSQPNLLMTDKLDATAIAELEKGGNVLLSFRKGSVSPDMGGDIKIGFSSIFWNTAWTRGQAPHTLGILCNPQHNALQKFPTAYHSDYQWWDAMSHSNAIAFSKISPAIKPIVRVIDDWFTNRPLALLFEVKIGKGKLLVSGIDFWSEMDKRPEARQLLYSIKQYMSSGHFKPDTETTTSAIQSITTTKHKQN